MAEETTALSLSERIAQSQQQLEASREQTTQNESDDPVVTGLTPTQQMELSKFNTVSLLCFAAVVMIVIALSIHKMDKMYLNKMLKIYGTVLILFLSVYLVITGWSTDQITPVIGLLGTVAGYLLGSSVNESTKAPKSDAPQGEGGGG